nr:MAG TPA: hypothetical protein [Caudoviricetes sp.]
MSLFIIFIGYIKRSSLNLSFDIFFPTRFYFCRHCITCI